MDEPEILFEKRGAAGIVTLNRPKALNALTHSMVVAMRAKLDEWADDPAVSIVVVRGAGERAFCAGGDIRAIAESGRAGTGYALDFWHDEYILNATIKHYPKPYVALIHGIAMGGGLGVSVHGEFRVADETVLFAMPETGIGFFPDVGGSYFLPRCPLNGVLGTYVALTGSRLKISDAIYMRMATDFVPANLMGEMVDDLCGGREVADAIKSRAQNAGTAPLGAHWKEVESCFSADTVEGILAALDGADTAWSRATAATIRTKSPTSLKLTFREMHEGKKLSFDDCMRMEYRMSSRILSGSDFYEGVRAVIVDKDNAPKWRPATLAEVTDKAIDAYFAPLGEKELKL